MSDLAIEYSDGSTAPEFSSGAVLVAVAEEPQDVPGVQAPAAPVSPQSPVPSQVFEGCAVGLSEIKISGACTIESAGEVTVSLDDLVRAVGVYRVVKVNHYVAKNGETVRQQVLAPVETLMVVPFDASNPSDDGIVRARP